MAAWNGTPNCYAAFYVGVPFGTIPTGEPTVAGLCQVLSPRSQWVAGDQVTFVQRMFIPNTIVTSPELLPTNDAGLVTYLQYRSIIPGETAYPNDTWFLIMDMSLHTYYDGTIYGCDGCFITYNRFQFI